ncbi:MAG TPA: hypothetical protein ENJ34_00260 [Epsilonproteobacteria bacterium]|nr:hypothetical protein [Campylobacterota bacterium]
MLGNENEVCTEKEEALRQINEIKNHLVDKQTFFPYNYNATFIWSAIAFVLTFSMVPMYERGVAEGTVFLFVFISVGFINEGFLTKRINESYDIQECTRRQQFIMKNFMMLSLFLIILSAVFASYKLYVPMFLSWLFLISLGYFAVGFVLNITRFTQMARFNIFASILLLSIGFLSDTLVGEVTYLLIVKVFMVLGLVFMPAVVAWHQKSEAA